MPKMELPFLIGTSGWTYSDWKGKFYPETLSKKEWFQYYTQHFHVIEINATYYRWFPPRIFIKWREAAPKHFLYVVKVPGIITHQKKLLYCHQEIKQFCQLTKLLKNKLGLILMQLPPSMPYDLPRPKAALSAFDHPQKVVVEFRHPRWITEEAKELLKEMGSIFCVTDSPAIKLQYCLTAKIGYIRLHGRTEWFDYDYTKQQLKEIARLAKTMRQHGAKQVYILFNNDIHAYAPKNAAFLQDLLSR
jgi:uncharacterized protein YecE (DUF72 family)